MLCEKTGYRYTHHQITTKKVEWCMRTDALLPSTITYCRMHRNGFIHQVLLPQRRQVDLQSLYKTYFWIKTPEKESVKSNKWHLSC